ncbi:MAG: hypothetical protein RL468_875 [Pseudomonadota bacterium]|jgi:4a-hydroxytetrahydrobiopterin dehydratase
MNNLPSSSRPRALRPTEIVTHLSNLPGWVLQGDGKEVAITRKFEFANFHEVMAFANGVAWIAHQLDHHPELILSYRSCAVTWQTHDAGGLTQLDFECAGRVNALLGASLAPQH